MKLYFYNFRDITNSIKKNQTSTLFFTKKYNPLIFKPKNYQRYFVNLFNEIKKGNP